MQILADAISVSNLTKKLGPTLACTSAPRDVKTASMSISLKEVQEIAHLARLRLSSDEATNLAHDLGSILDYMEKLRALDTEGVPPMTHAVPLDCPLRADVAGPSFSQDEALAGAPSRVEGFFEVPRIIDSEPKL